MAGQAEEVPFVYPCASLGVLKNAVPDSLGRVREMKLDDELVQAYQRSVSDRAMRLCIAGGLQNQLMEATNQIRKAEGAAIVLSSEALLDVFLNGRDLRGAGTTNPFPKVDKALKRYRASDSNGRPLWVALGWVRFADLGQIREAGGCRDGWTKVCAERNSSGNYLVRTEVGHRGWPLDGFGFVKLEIAREPGLGRAADRAIDFLASKAASEVLQNYYLIVPHDDVRMTRKVIFEVWDLRKNEKLASTENKGSYPLPGPKLQQGEFNVCGGPANACPQFYEVPDRLNGSVDYRIWKLRDAVKSAFQLN